MAPKIATPSPVRQKERLDKKIQDIVAAFDGLQANPDGFDPERVIVFETVADTVTEFAKAVAKVEGLEWIHELDLGEQASDDDFQIPGKSGERLSSLSTR